MDFWAFPIPILLALLAVIPVQTALGDCSNRLTKVYADRLDLYLANETSHPRGNLNPTEDRPPLSIGERCVRSVTGIDDQVFQPFEKIAPYIFEKRDVACIKAAQKYFLLRQSKLGIQDNRIVYCNSPQDRIIDENQELKLVDPPCDGTGDQPGPYSTLNAYLFKKIAACSQIPPGELFRLFANESGFHPDMVSETKCMGIGQMSVLGIKDIHQLNAHAKRLLDHSDASSITPDAQMSPYKSSVYALAQLRHRIETDRNCQPFKKVYRYEGDPTYRCQFLHHSVNPEIGYLLATQAYLVNRTKVRSNIEDWREDYPPLKKLSSVQIDRLTASLATIAHNSGLPSLEAQFTIFLKSSRSEAFFKRLSSLSPSSAVDTYIEEFSKHLAEHYPVASRNPLNVMRRRSEVSEYYENARNRAIEIERIVGGGKREACFR